MKHLLQIMLCATFLSLSLTLCAQEQIKTAPNTFSKINSQIRNRMIVMEISKVQLAECLSKSDYRLKAYNLDLVKKVWDNKLCPIGDLLEDICDCLDVELFYYPNGAPFIIQDRRVSKRDIDNN